MKNRKALFCYFATDYIQYVPLDLGIYFSLIKKKNLNIDLYAKRFDFDTNKFLKEITKYNADIIVIILDNIIWTGVYAYLGALKISKILKANNPELIIGFQSCKINEKEISKALETIDFIVAMNPESAFSDIDKILNKEYVNGVFTKDYKNHTKEEIDINKLPSPYLEGIFDSFINYRAKKKQQMFIVTSKGCIYGCYYCHRSIRYEKIQYFKVKRVFDEIEYLHNKGINNLTIIDDCFITTEERLKDFEIEFLKRKEKNSCLDNINFQVLIRPDLLDEQIIKRLNQLNINIVQMGIQTINPNLQYLIKRDMDLSKLDMIAKLLHKYSIKIKIDLILGLPGDTIDYFKKTLDQAIRMKPIRIRPKQLYLNPGTRIDKEKEEFELKVSRKRDFFVPFISQSKGITKEYKKETLRYLKQKISENRHIRWDYVLDREFS
jgi:radical SAM superfamily enzyme YgiQ (UPF0313 family)